MTLVFFWLGKSALDLIASIKARQDIRPHRCDLYSEIFYIVKRPVAYIGVVTLADIEENMADIAFYEWLSAKLKSYIFCSAENLNRFVFKSFLIFGLFLCITNVDWGFRATLII